MKEYSSAYASVKERFRLKAAQRDILDASEDYEQIMKAAQAGEFVQVFDMLKKAGVL